MEEVLENQVGGDKQQDEQQPPSSSSIDMEDIMESMVRITFCGLGGTIVGLSLEKRLESMKITTAEGIAAAARRKRGRIASYSSHQSAFPLSMTWAVSCMVFCSIMEVSRLTSPSTWIVNQVGALNVNGQTPNSLLGCDDDDDSDSNNNNNNKTKSTTAVAISVADYSIGGAVAGIVCSFGRRMYSRNSVVKLHSPRARFSGLLPGLALGVAAGTIQSAIDYGTDWLKTSSNIQQ